MGFGIIEKTGFFFDFDAAKQAAEEPQEGTPQETPQERMLRMQQAAAAERMHRMQEAASQMIQEQQRAGQQQLERIERLREKLVRYQTFYDRIPAFETQPLPRERCDDLYNGISEHIIVLSGLIRRELDDPEVAVVRAEAEDLKIKLQERMLDLYRYMMGFYDSEEQLAGWIDDIDRLPFSELPLTDEQRAEIKDYIGERIAEIQAGETTAASGTQSRHGQEASEESAPWDEQGVMIFIQRDPEAESQAITDIEGWWGDIGTYNEQIMASYLPLRAACQDRSERREVQQVIDQLRGSAGAAVDSSHESENRVPQEVLRESGLVLPTEQSIIDLPNGARICDETSEEDGAVTFVYLDEVDPAEPPRDMDEFTESIMNVVGENYGRFIDFMRALGSEYPHSFEIELQLYMTDDGRIRTIAATYDDEDYEYAMPQPDGDDPLAQPPQNPVQLRTQRITEAISRGIAAPANMQYYRIKMEISFFEGNTDGNIMSVDMLPF